MTKLFFTTLIAAVLSVHLNAQTGGISINTTGAAPDPSAMLDISGTSTGILINRMTNAERNAIANPAVGLQIYNTTTNCLNMWTGNSWKQSCFDCDFTSPAAGNNGPICEGATLSLTATYIEGATYQWSGPNGFTSSLQNPDISNASASSSGTYSVAATLNGCTSQLQNTVATVTTIPSAPVAGNDGPKCVGESLALSASTVAGATLYNWTGPNGYSTNIQNPTIGNIQATDAGTYSVTASVNGCVSDIATTSVSIHQTPAVPGTITGSAGICANSSGNVYSIAAVSGATSYNWSVPSGGSITENNGTDITVTFGNSSGDITVSATNECGTSATNDYSVSITGGSGSQTFNATGSGPDGTIQTFTVPQCITSVTIETWGAEGGMRSSSQGGRGARMRGTFTVTPGDVLQILVGQKGNDQASWGGGGGGGTFVAKGNNYATAVLLIAAGGGGGGPNGSDGTTDQNGTAGGGPPGAGGTNGNGGSPGANGDYAGAGAGWLTNGGGGTRGGTRFQEGGAGSATGDARGGFGGGGGSWNSGAGGGGYSGGGGGGNNSPIYGGGGGSYNSGTNQSNTSGVQTGNGQVIISW